MAMAMREVGANNYSPLPPPASERLMIHAPTKIPSFPPFYSLPHP